MILQKRSLAEFPIQFFAVLMGISGLTIVYGKAYHILNFSSVWYLSLLLLNTTLFFIIFIIYVLKWAKYPEKIKAEMMHPIKSSFIPALSISFLLLSIAYYDYAPTIAVTLWFVGAPLHLIFTIRTIRFWMTHNKLNINHMNPAWFIPVVGNVLVPVIGVDLLPVEVSIFYFAIGIFFWLMLFIIVMYRMIFHDPIPQKLIPTLFILLAPPAVGFISYFRITSGSIDMISMFLYAISLIISLLIASKVNIFAKVEFFISWWAYTFPLAAMTIASIILYQTYNNMFMYVVSLLFLIITTLVIIFVFYRTILAIKENKICIEE